MDYGAFLAYQYYVFYIDCLFSKKESYDSVGLAFITLFSAGTGIFTVSGHRAEFPQRAHVQDEGD